MKLNGIHHITAITGDAQRNVDFYVGVMGLRLVKKSVNQDDPTVYHLFYGDEEAKPGLDLTFFEYPGAAPGRAGEGMIHRVVWRVGAPEALDFWSERLAANGVDSTREGETLVLSDPFGTGIQHKRNYSVKGKTTDCTFHVRPPLKADGSSVFGRRGALPVKLKPSCGDAKLAPTIKLTYTGDAPAGPNETVSSVGSANSGATMRWAGKQYIYNLALKGQAPGKYRLSFNVAGVEAAYVTFTLRGAKHGAAGKPGQGGKPGKSDKQRGPR